MRKKEEIPKSRDPEYLRINRPLKGISYFSIWIESKPIVWDSSCSITDKVVSTIKSTIGKRAKRIPDITVETTDNFA